jgi:hypothetical protein
LNTRLKERQTTKFRSIFNGAEGEREVMATPTPPWTAAEEDKLRKLILSAKSVEAIARLLNRTPKAVRKRASKLQLPLRAMERRSC